MEQKSIITEAHIAKINEYAKDIKYGSIVLVFQDGKLIQIEKNEKIRLV